MTPLPPPPRPATSKSQLHVECGPNITLQSVEANVDGATRVTISVRGASRHKFQLLALPIEDAPTAEHRIELTIPNGTDAQHAVEAIQQTLNREVL